MSMNAGLFTLPRSGFVQQVNPGDVYGAPDLGVSFHFLPVVVGDFFTNRIYMKFNKLVISTFMAVTLLGCNSTSVMHKASVESELRMMTHKLVSTDSSFESSIVKLMPKGVKRMEKDELSLTSVITPDGEVNYNTYSSMVSRTEVKSLLGSPVRDDKQYNVYSYNGSNNSFITFVFNSSSKVERIEGYSNSNNW